MENVTIKLFLGPVDWNKFNKNAIVSVKISWSNRAIVKYG